MHRLDFTRIVKTALLSTAGLTLFAIGVLPTAIASTPEAVVVSADSDFINDFDCAFPLQEQVRGMYRDTLYFDRDGVLTREFISPHVQGPLTITWTNSATGRSLHSSESSTLWIYYNPDGSFRYATNQGLTFAVHVPGEGLLLLDAGRIAIERGHGITFQAGPHQELDGDTATFCTYLAS